ncbi:MAG TPA: hypothetical protein VFI02_04845 [Armatimonadota bacterium]|nr:hypothetical protein [Armatimonadota bacterium]
MPPLPKVLKKWLGDSYEYLGLVLMSSFIWFGITLSGIGLIVGLRSRPVLVIVLLAAHYVLVISPLTAAVLNLAKSMVTRDEPSLLDLIRGFKEFLTASWMLGLVQLLLTLVIVVNAWFYLTHGGIVIRILGVLTTYVLILWMMSAVYHFPILIEQRPGTFRTIKRGFLLTLDNPGFTAGVFLAIILLTCFSAATLLGLPLLYMGMLGILETRALRAVFVKYEILEPEKEYKPEDDAE